MEKVIFNKNHISIKRGDDYPPQESSICSRSINRSNDPHYWWNTRPMKKVKKISPLGFYYYGYEKTKQPTREETDVITQWSIGLKNLCSYTITYVSSHGQVRIGTDLRPWEIVDKIGIEDHFITDLFEELNKIFTEASGYKIEGFSEKKAAILKDLYGDPRGPIKLRTDKQKIEAHGFDFKESFRKPKEK